MAQFIGKWQAGKGSMSNFEAFGKAMGLSDEILDKFRDSSWTVTFSKDGDTWLVENESSVSPKRTYSYQEGKELVTTNMFGKGLKLTTTFDSDTKMTIMEQTENENGWKSLKAVREINGDKMVAVSYTDEMITMSKASNWTFEFTKDGDKWSVSNESTNTPRTTNTYEEGKDLVTKSSSGKCLKVVKIEDSANNMSYFYPSLVNFKWKGYSQISLSV
ncbi:unnamed protein product [Mytilus coruscus]|uniref:Uncharacterized protein n=1 Tax=Mytilus coruscus TaxID=42192 RepID=A0A6J8C6D3_MYTCO|nr:unnamed protein product [Mytilus coruscus]